VAPASPQRYANHARYVVGFHGVALILVAANLVWSVVHLFRQRFSVPSVFGLVVAVALAQLFWYVRVFAAGNQDRIIRIEMRLRLERLLPADLAARIPELTTPQLVALRFAGDAELPELARKVLDERISSQKEIKLLVRDWQADHQRV
jgi:hypothetical protein